MWWGGFSYEDTETLTARERAWFLKYVGDQIKEYGNIKFGLIKKGYGG